MSQKQRSIIQLLKEGKSYPEIAHRMRITQSNLQSTIYQMRKKGIKVEKCKPKLFPTKSQLTVLTLYSEGKSIEEIANLLRIAEQSVVNHAHGGFKRLGLTVPGQDRLAELKRVLHDPYEKSPITMDDPFFN